MSCYHRILARLLFSQCSLNIPSWTNSVNIIKLHILSNSSISVQAKQMKAWQSFLAFQILKEMVLWKTYKGENILILHSEWAYTRFTHTGGQGDSASSPAWSRKRVFAFPAPDLSGLVGYTGGE